MKITLTVLEEIANPWTGEEFMRMERFEFDAAELGTALGIDVEALNAQCKLAATIAAAEGVWKLPQIAESDRNEWSLGDRLDFDAMATYPFVERVYRVAVTA